MKLSVETSQRYLLKGIFYPIDMDKFGGARKAEQEAGISVLSSLVAHEDLSIFKKEQLFNKRMKAAKCPQKRISSLTG